MYITIYKYNIMSSSSSRIASLKYATNRRFNKRKVENKFKKPLESLHAYGLRTNNFYNQNKISFDALLKSLILI